jgi:glycosyltransferase involved in cell wall biosynthesis
VRPDEQLAVRAVAPAAARLPSLSAFVPAFDEEESLGAVLDALVAVLPEVADRWELVVVDDGSTDGTAAVADAVSRRHRHVRVVRHPENRGYGAALRTGLASSRHAWVFWTDGDGQIAADELRRLVDALGDADAVLGWRANRAEPLLRRAFTAAWNRLVRRVFRIRVRDVNCAAKLVRRSALRSLPASTGAAASAEILVTLLRGGARVVEVPVRHLPRRAGRPTGGSPRVALRAIRELIALARRLG